MRAVIRLRSSINANIEVKDTLKHLRLNKINHCVLIPRGKTYDGMLHKIKDYATWGEIRPEILTNLLLKRGRLTGNRLFDNNYIKANTKSDSMLKYADAIISGKERYSDMKDVQPVFRLHPPLKGHKGIKNSFNAGGDLGYRGDDINNLILKMLGPIPVVPKTEKTSPKKETIKPKPKKEPAKLKKETAKGSETKAQDKKPAPKKTAKPVKKPAPKKEAKK